jgi:hypothetical protein
MLRQKEEEEKEAAAAAEEDQDRWMHRRKNLAVTWSRLKTSWHKPLQVPVWGRRRRRRRCAKRCMLMVLRGTAMLMGY